MSDFTKGVDMDAAEDRGTGECGCAEGMLDQSEHADRAVDKAGSGAADESE